MAGKFITTTKDIGLLQQLYRDGQLTLTPEFQRYSVWPRAARAFLIDTILEGFPIPVLYFQRQVSAQTSRVQYAVVDGQQRLNSVFAFMDNRFMLTESSPDRRWHRKRWSQLEPTDRERILSYDFTVQEITGFRNEDIREMFRRMNRFVVSLNRQEYRHSDSPGAFKRTVEAVGSWAFWTDSGVVTRGAAQRMRNDELAAELLILLNEGPQDKKASVDFYYEDMKESFPDGEVLTERLQGIFEIISGSLPEIRRTPYKRPANLYALVGALAELQEEEFSPFDLPTIGDRLLVFAEDLDRPEDSRPDRATEYLAASSSQTDNIRPRRRRIDILKQVISGA